MLRVFANKKRAIYYTVASSKIHFNTQQNFSMGRFSPWAVLDITMGRFGLFHGPFWSWSRAVLVVTVGRFRHSENLWAV